MPERFWAKVSQDRSGCWLWTATLNHDGYGRIRLRRDWVPLAHRAIWEVCLGPLENRRELDHKCRVRHCVNPDHLESVTHAENVRRGNGGAHWAAKTHCPQGHPYDAENTRGSGGRRVCRACSNERSRAWRLANPEKHRASVRQSRERRARSRAGTGQTATPGSRGLTRSSLVMSTGDSPQTKENTMAEQPQVQVTDAGQAPEDHVTVNVDGVDIFVHQDEAKSFVQDVYRDYNK